MVRLQTSGKNMQGGILNQANRAAAYETAH